MGIIVDQYSVYWIRKDIAYYFFHKSDVLYRFLTSYEERANEELFAQYEYITKEFPSTLISHIEYFSQEQGIHVRRKGQTFELVKNSHYATLKVERKSLQMYCRTIHCAEFLIFSTLRSFHPLLFIINHNLHNYGWITPFLKIEQY